VTYVQNFWTNINAGPLITELPPGKYLVLMDEPNHIPKFFWVTIEKGKMTIVNEAPAAPPEAVPTPEAAPAKDS
jgi:hypothetical protein